MSVVLHPAAKNLHYYPFQKLPIQTLYKQFAQGVQVDEIVFESTEPGTTFSWITNATANIDG